MNLLPIQFSRLVGLSFAWAILSSLIYTNSVKAVTNESISAPVTPKAVCPTENSRPKRSFETPKYQAYICLGNNKNTLGYYVRVTKSDGSKITVPLTRKNGETYIANNGDIGYVISPYELLVTKYGRTVVRERVSHAMAASGQIVTNYCPDGQNIFLEAVTKNFIIYICGTDKPGSYVAIARNGNEKITLPLQNSKSISGEDKQYTAVEGDTRYMLDRAVLRVFHGSKIIIKEKVLRWQ